VSGIFANLLGPADSGSLFLLSLGVDVETRSWLEFIEKMRLHHEVIATNIIGVRQVLEAGSASSWLLGGIVGILFISSLSRVDDTQAAILGGTLVFGLLAIADYYYAFLLVFLLWDSWENADARRLMVVGLLFFSASIGVVLLRALNAPMIQHFQAATLGLLLIFAVLFIQIHFPGRPEKRSVSPATALGELLAKN
jgi:hypothetical protein